MYNLGKVVKFEILKQIRKPLFWIAIFAFPAIMLVFSGVMYLSNKLASDQGEVAKQSLDTSLEKIVIVDKGNIINKDLLKGTKAELATDEAKALENFKQKDSKQALVILPKEIATESTTLYSKVGKDKAETQQISMGLESFTKGLISNSVENKVDKNTAAILRGKTAPTKNVILDENGKEYNPMAKMIVPGIFLVIFYFIFIFTGNQTLQATTEEKENRVAEMILTTVKAKTLIVGKIIALVLLGFIQIIALLTPMIIFYFVATKYFNLPPFISQILDSAEFELWPIIFGAVYLVFGTLLMTGFTILAGSLFPTAQDAAQFYTPIILSSMLPFYFVGAIFSGAKSVIVTILSFFPLSAPVTLLMRNTANNLPFSEAIIGLVIIIVSTVIIMYFAIRAFRKGAFKYDAPSFKFLNKFAKNK